MDELLTSSLNAAGCYVQRSDECFEITIGSSGTMPPNHEPIRTAPSSVSFTTAADSQESAWVAHTFCPNAPVSSIPGDPEWGGLFISEPVVRFLTQMKNDLAELSEPVRSSPGAEICRRFTEGVGQVLAYIPQARCAVFGDEEEGVELVVHSRASMRQISFAFKPEEDAISIVTIDEEMRRSERTCGIDKVRTLAEAIAWLNPS